MQNKTSLSTSQYIADRELREHLKRARKSSHLSQKEVAIISGLSANTVSNIENPDKKVEYISILKYIDAVGCEIRLDKKYPVDDKSDNT